MSDDTETVARIWRQLGSPSYEALNGRSIHDLIDGLLADRQRLATIEAAASEAVTEEMVRVAWDAHADGAACEVLANTGQVYAALLAVAPALLLAGEARGLERAAADYERRADYRCTEADSCDAGGDRRGAEVARSLASHYRLTATELRALTAGEIKPEGE